MKVVALVPMKLNNQRLPNKNIKAFIDGKPLCHFVLDTLQQVKNLDKIYVYCSDNMICNYIPEGINYLSRSTELDKDTTKINEVLHAFAEEVPADIYVLSHATAPFITKESIEKGIAAVKSEVYDSALAVSKIQEFLWKDNKPFNYDLENIPRTQDLTLLYSETCGLYIYTRDLIMKKNRRIGFNPYLIEVSKVEACDIDEQEDFDIANAIYNFKLCGGVSSRNIK